MANKRFQSKYKNSHSFEYRKSEADKVRERHPDRLPIICEKVDSSAIHDLDKNKFLVPSDLTIGQFIVVLRKRIMLESTAAVFVFIGESVPPNTAGVVDLYTKYKDEDGFLYVKYASENVFGSL